MISDGASNGPSRHHVAPHVGAYLRPPSNCRGPWGPEYRRVLSMDFPWISHESPVQLWSISLIHHYWTPVIQHWTSWLCHHYEQPQSNTVFWQWFHHYISNHDLTTVTNTSLTIQSMRHAMTWQWLNRYLLGCASPVNKWQLMRFQEL